MRISRLLCLFLFAAFIFSCNSGRTAAEVEKLRQEREELLNRIEMLREEQRFLRFEKDLTVTDKRYLVLDTQKRGGSLRLGGKVLREFRLALDECIRPEASQSEGAGQYPLPKGAIQIIAKKKDPVWYKPDWMYEQEGKLPPPVSAAEHLIKGALGEYALYFGGGFVIHGRPLKDVPRVPMQHACIILADDDLRVVFNLLEKGAVAYVK